MNSIEPKIVFFGTPDIGIPVLNAVAKRFNVVLVVTNSDKEQGRGRKVQSSDIKIAAENLELTVLQPDDIKSEEFANQLKETNADIFLVFAYKILPSNLLSIPKIGSFNIHPSLLPKYRGAAPINHTIINGDNETGITTFLLEEKVDAGGILFQIRFQIELDMTAGDLYEIVKQKAPEIAIKTIEQLASGDKNILRQDISQVTKAPKIFRENCELDFSKTAICLKNFINGVSPLPGAWKIWNGKNMKFLRAKVAEGIRNLSAGEFEILAKRFFIGCSEGAIEILELQSEGKKQMKTADFLNGYRGDFNGIIS